MPHKKKITLPKLAILVRNADFFTSGDYEFDIITEYKRVANFWKYDVILTFISEQYMQEKEYSHFMQSQNVAGAFLLGFSPEDAWIKQLSHTDIPTVLLECEVPSNPHVCSIGSDHIFGMESAVSYLQTLGHTRIALLNGPLHLPANLHHQEGYLKSLKKHGLTISKKLYTTVTLSPYTIKPAVTKVVKAGATSIICGSDKIASAVITECRALGYHIPQDISIVGYQDLALCERTFPPLTSVREERSALGYFAFSSLRELLLDMPLQNTCLRSKLILRGSTAASPHMN